ncbi:FIST signal transduction protein [Skermanella stibiiresistens]|uniref:FIST signal transduction protein n=1 Tax=Skermanella stibiiresistens TaxID=913326 RepID=UPI001FE00695|nr:FIST N-terminal domain-containing protein [Skermanella stibiiresistens]
MGRGNNPDPREAGAEAARRAVAALVPGMAPSWALLFCGGKHDPAQVLAGLRSVVGVIAVVGGSAAGAITAAGFGYSGFEVAVGLFPSDIGEPAILVDDGLLDGEGAAGRRLGDLLVNVVDDGRVVFLFYDSVASTSPPRLHPASPLVEGIYQGLGSRRPHLVGAGTLTDMNLSDGYVFDGTRPRKHTAVAVVLPPSLRAETTILHGCVPVSTFMRITGIDGAEVMELDGRPALDVLEGMLGIEVGEDQTGALSLMVTLGEKHGDPFAEYDENRYVNRLILQASPERRSITLFEPDFRLGSVVQIMSRDNGLMVQSVRDGVRSMNERFAGRRPVMALYIDCAGRAGARSGSEIEEAEVLLDEIAIPAPLLGFYSGVEIAPVGDAHSRSLDWTAVLTILHGDPAGGDPQGRDHDRGAPDTGP